MKLRNHKPTNLDTQRRLQLGALSVLADGIHKSRAAIYGHHYDRLPKDAVARTVNALPWAVRPTNRSPKRLARLKHALTVLTLQSA